MKTEEIVKYVISEVVPKYNSLQKQEKKIYHAILQSLPSSVLDDIKDKLYEKEYASWELLRFIEWLQSEHTTKEGAPNEPISTLLRWYEDKTSKKVSYAYTRLTKRFEGQSLVDQKKILRAFLSGGKKSSEWAARQLRKKWISGLEKEIVVSWKTHKSSAMARTIIYMMPEEFVLKEQDELVRVASDIPDAYAILCGRLGRMPGFKIDETRLSITDWFYVVGKLRLVERISELDEKTNQFIRNLNSDVFSRYDSTSENSLLYRLGMGPIIWAMKRLGYTEGLIRLARIEQEMTSFVNATDIKENIIPSSINCLKALIEKDGKD